ncbi:MAG: 3-deoxy-manno-octulosonate cytidylyltransferase [Gammaproteobacteria bacterium]
MKQSHPAKFVVVIPARYGSTRLPGKALLPLGDKPMVVRTYEQAASSRADRVVVATDDERIREAIIEHGGEVCMTSPDHPSGTDRVAEVARKLRLAHDAIVVNVQGDEPLIPPSIIAQVATNLAEHEDMDMATLAEPINPALLHDRAAVKVVRAHKGRALYFSRSTVPWYRDAFAAEPDTVPAETLIRRHVGIYAYRVSFLEQFVAWPACPLENAEALEQLRALYYGGAIHVDDAVEEPGPGVDTAEDLERARALIEAREA